MNSILMFIMKNCPYSRKALSLIEQLKNEDPKYADIEVNVIDEVAQPEIANKYDYYYVPSFFIDGVKVHEGPTTKEIIQNIFEKAYKSGDGD